MQRHKLTPSPLLISMLAFAFACSDTTLNTDTATDETDGWAGKSAAISDMGGTINENGNNGNGGNGHCKLDCHFDKNHGAGNDKCEQDLRCDPETQAR
jgi:hypothetical protein